MTGEHHSQSHEYPLVLLNRHTGERLELTRFEGSSGPWLEIRGRLPPRSEGPPLHIHVHEDEGGRVVSGRISARLGDTTLHGSAGEGLNLPRGVPHRWWNAGDEVLVFEGHAHPVLDVDRFLHALFEVVNAGPPDRPPLFYMAHVLHRHRHTQIALVMPPLVQRLLFPLVIAAGHLLGRYRGDGWPGCPARCLGAPTGGTREVPWMAHT